MFYVRADLSVGSYSTIKDLGSNAQRDYVVVVDVEELASTSYLAQVYIRETESDDWQLVTGTGSDSADMNALLTVQGTFRYVKVNVTTTGDVFESGVVAY